MTITAEQAAKLLEGIDSQVISAAYDLGPNGKLNPLWVFVDCGQNAMRFGRWARGMKNPAPYVRLDLALDALIASEAARKLAEERLERAVGAVRPFADVADLFDSEVEGVGSFDTLSLWLNGDDEEPAWRAMDFNLGDFGGLSAILKEIDNG